MCRHESLRTRIISIDGAPRQQIENSWENHLDVIDVTGLAQDNAESVVEGLAAQILAERVDLSAGPLFK